VTGFHLHAVKPAAVHGHDRSLNINEVILAQICCPLIYVRISGYRPCP
jgi:hypothetical protein